MDSMQRVLKDKGTIAIMSVYDPDGIVDEYIIYFLLSLKKVADRIIIAVNGKLTSDGKNKLRTTVDEIYIRENRGFDFGAYKDVIYNYLSLQELYQYQDLILCNDTCFGPLIPFEDIFSQMDIASCDFWSMNYMEDLLLPHFQSYFMVFKERAIRLMTDFLDREVDSNAAKIEYAHGYEHALSEIILQSGLKSDYYTSGSSACHDMDIYAMPDDAIKYLGFPMLKKKIFSGKFCRYENIREALRLIADKKDYPMEYILEYVHRVYPEEYTEDAEKKPQIPAYTFEKNETTRNEVIEFCRKHKELYVYGNGYMSALFMARFKRYIDEFKGYIVSDEYYRESVWEGEKIFPLSYIGTDAAIIVALTKKSAREVVDKVADRENILFLSMKRI